MHDRETDLEPVREQTNLGLDQERTLSDAAIGIGIDEDSQADEDLDVRRSQADQNLRVRRQRSDALLRDQRGPPSHVTSEGVDAERALVDSERQRERGLADALIARERKRLDETLRIYREKRQAVDDLLGLERAETDDRLRLEREKTDEVVGDAGALLFEEQRRSQRDVARRDDFLALVSHELRNPLTSIAVSAQTLLDLGPQMTERLPRGIAEDVQVACAQMERLVSDLLDGVGIESGRLRVTLVPSDVRCVLRAAVAASASLLRRRCLSTLVEAPDGPLVARIDHARMLQVFANLFANAAKFTPPGGSITVSVAAVGSSIRFCVADTGAGMPAPDLPRVFDRFWQRESQDRRGLGLGLYICKGIIEAHGGQIGVDSAPGVGSSFFFTLPAVG
jgi:signal transduction histidine kinase